MGRTRRGGHVRELAHAGERPGRVPREPAGPHPADLLRGVLHAADLRPGHERHAAFRIHVPAAGWFGRFVRRRHVWTRRAGSRAPHFQSARINSELKSPTAYIFSAAVERRLGAIHVGKRDLQRLALRPIRSPTATRPGWSAMACNVNSTPGDLLTKPPGSAADAAQSELRLDRVRGQRSRRQLQRRHIRHARPRSRAVLRHVVHAIRLEGRHGHGRDRVRYRIPEPHRSASVLRAVAVGRAAPAFADVQLHRARPDLEQRAR